MEVEQVEGIAVPKLLLLFVHFLSLLFPDSLGFEKENGGKMKCGVLLVGGEMAEVKVRVRHGWISDNCIYKRVVW